MNDSTKDDNLTFFFPSYVLKKKKDVKKPAIPKYPCTRYPPLATNILLKTVVL